MGCLKKPLKSNDMLFELYSGEVPPVSGPGNLPGYPLPGSGAGGSQPKPGNNGGGGSGGSGGSGGTKPGCTVTPKGADGRVAVPTTIYKI